MSQQVLPVATTSNPTQLTKSDLAVVTAAYKSRAKKFERWGAVGVLGGLAIGSVMMSVATRIGWGDRWDPVFFFGAWGIALVALTVNWRRHRAAIADLQVHCAHCSEPLIGEPRFLRIDRPAIRLARAELVVATGSCPNCGHEFLSNEA